ALMKMGRGTIRVAAAQSSDGRMHNILNQLPSPYLSQLMKVARPMHLARGEVLFREGEPGDSCYWVLKGTLKVGVSSAKGEERIFALLGPGSVVGELAVLDNLPRSATATAVSDTDLTVLKRDALLTYLRENFSVCADLISILVGRLRKADEELSADTFLTVQTRVARAILGLVDQTGVPGGP